LINGLNKKGFQNTITTKELFSIYLSKREIRKLDLWNKRQ